MRTAEEVMMRCKLILDQPDIVLLINKSSSPTAAYDMVMDATHDDKNAPGSVFCVGIIPISKPKSPTTL